MSICGGIAGRRGRNPLGATIHNDAGGQNANAGFYNIWLRTHDLAAGFAHYYVANDYTLQAEDDGNCAWHCGNTTGNVGYLSFEACQSMGDLAVFRQNEDNTLKLVAQKFRQYGIVPNENTVRLHQEFSSTACPHRSVAIHGGAAATKQYFISKIKQYMGMNTGVVPAVGASPETIPWNSTEVGDMQQFFTIDGGKTVYYFNGYDIRGLCHPDELNALNEIYKQNHGKDMLVVDYKSKAPYYKRLLAVLNRKPVTTL